MARRRRVTRLSLPVFLLLAGTYVLVTLWQQKRESPESSKPSCAPAVETGRGNTRIDSFNEAKKKAAVIFAGQTEFYCGCRYSEQEVDLASCRYQVKRNANRAKRLEWEHIVPAENFGRSFVEWREGHPECVRNDGTPFKGRNCAQKVSRVFRLMEADLYNL